VHSLGVGLPVEHDAASLNNTLLFCCLGPTPASKLPPPTSLPLLSPRLLSISNRYALRPAPLVFPPSIADVVKMQVHDPAQHTTHSVTPQRAGVLLDQVAAASTPNLAGPAASGPWQPALRVYFKESLVTGSDKPGRWALTTWPPFPEQVRRLVARGWEVGWHTMHDRCDV
jgi:hypothetical protein